MKKNNNNIKNMEDKKNETHTEGPVAEAIEKETSKLPSDLFLWGGLACLAAAAILQCTRHKHTSLLVGQWAAPILIMGLYNKVVKQQGHDYKDKTPE